MGTCSPILSVNFGGEHFGVGFTKAVGAVLYHWLIDNGSGVSRCAVAPFRWPRRTFTYYPPVSRRSLPQIVAVIATTPPPGRREESSGKRCG